MATNAPWALGHALYRAGRFQRLLFVPPPPLEARKRILMEAVSNIPGADKIAFDRIALKSAGFSGADLRALADWVSNASLTKALAGASDASITTALFEEGLKLFGPSTRNWLSLAKAEMKPIHRHEALGRLFFPLYRV
jgi:SpoVK/Ycf46/Vps4 family AAA+-type ATPase